MPLLYPLFLLQITFAYFTGYTLPLLGAGLSLVLFLLSVIPAVSGEKRIKMVLIVMFFLAGSTRGILHGPFLPPDNFGGIGEKVRFFGKVTGVSQSGPLVHMVIRDGVLESVSNKNESRIISRFGVNFFGDSQWYSENKGNTVLGLGRMYMSSLNGNPSMYAIHSLLDRTPCKINTSAERLLFFGSEERAGMRDRFIGRVIHALNENDGYDMGRAFLIGVLTGKRKHHSELRKVLVDTGLAHLLAISGLHVGVAIMFFAVISRFFLLLPVFRKVLILDVNFPSFFAGAIAGMFYVYLSNIPVTAARAFAMIVFSAVAVRNYDRSSVFTPIAFALFVVTLSNPANVSTASFIFSFLITSYLVLLLGRKSSLSLGTVKISLIISLTAYCVSIPLSSYFFGCASLFGFLYNILFVPLFIPLIASSLAWAFLCIGGFPFTKMIGSGLVAVADSLLRAVRWCAVITGPASQIPKPDIINMVCYFFALTFLFLLSLKMGKNSDKLL